MTKESIILKADFNPRVRQYWLLSTTIVLTCTIVGIPFLLIWLPLGLYFTQRHLDRMECVLTSKALKVKKGIFVRMEKTVPLEKITDMGMVQGPIMRHFDVHTLTVETAGQSGQGALVSLTGIVNAPDFREAVLNQRDALDAAPQPDASSAPASSPEALLTEIRDTLLRIESSLKKDV